MIEIMPFRGIRYNKELIGSFRDVVTPPYDKIDDKLQSVLYERSPYNFVRLNKGREADKYDSARRHLDEWLSSNVLIQDSEPSIYIYNQEYTFAGVKKNRKGFIALLKLDEFSNGNVFPHEHTLKGPKADRLSLIEKTEATFGQIFMLFSDLDKSVFSSLSSFEENSPIMSVLDDDDNIHSVWKVDDASVISLVQERMKDKKIYIADGHHRYETSIDYRNQLRNKLGDKYKDSALSNYIMCTFIDMDDYEGMSILPTHRFVRDIDNFDFNTFLSKLEENFIVKPYSSLGDLEYALYNANHSFGLVLDRGRLFCLISFRDISSIDSHFPKHYSSALKTLDLTILHKLILEEMLGIDEQKLTKQSNVDYFRNKEEAISLLEAGNYEMGFLLNPTKIEEIKSVTESGEKMPQKSTDFYPKLLSGLLVFSIKER